MYGLRIMLIKIMYTRSGKVYKGIQAGVGKKIRVDGKMATPIKKKQVIEDDWGVLFQKK